ncbi:MAG: NAD(P)/FAD-dependent oxidoreductase [Bacillota bacterium]|nr:NAD(P)/FAD-dependent oxidoreductase [Bacillota bacterium]
MSERQILVIGGGPAGIMAALTAAAGGAPVTLLERNQRLGRKLAITGKGRCNITNNSAIEQIIANLGANGSFLYGALSRFSVADTLDFFTQAGLPLKTERGGRVFPKSDRAADVAAVLQRQLQIAGVRVLYGRRIRHLSLQEGAVRGVIDAEGRAFPAAALIVATGGMTYPATGSSGDGYDLAREAGHSIVRPRPSLVPLETVETWPAQLSGLSLRNVELSVYDGERLLGREFGEMLFTHFGVSGPIVLSLSRLVTGASGQGAGLGLRIDLKPALSVEQLERRLQRDLDAFSRRHLVNALDELLPLALVKLLPQLAGVDAHKPANQISRAERGRLLQTLKALPLTVKGARPIDEAIVTAGGVKLAEIEPQTMRSKLTEGLYFAGEVLDIDGMTGGYNLQAAWSSGFVAGQAAAKFFSKTS